MIKIQKQAHDMMKALNTSLPQEDGPGLHNITHKDFTRLKNLVSEEHKEFQYALSQVRTRILYLNLPADGDEVLRSWSEMIDGMCDIIFAILVSANTMGIDIEPFLDEVHRTNLKRVGGRLLEDGKIMKPVGWEPPKIFEMIKALMNKNE